ncbi:hypothetical protein ACFQX7_00250 [Luedemannella flava]
MRISVSRAFGAPLTATKRSASWRTVRAGLLGTSHARPNARSSVATATRVRAASVVEVKVCGTSSGAGT